jgi:NAD(P)-dependent dehydrogenase (short-subunit alcohol dehydrogenase family)
MSDLRFDGRVAIVTGAGRGIGREHALLLGARGAVVVVNDLGSERDGTGVSSGPAAEVAAEIVAAGGQALANSDSVADEAGAAAIVDAAVDTFGRVDVVVNNAGNFSQRAFDDLTIGEFQAMVDVHHLGTVLVTKAAWPHMVLAGYGRIVNTVSAAMLGMDGMTHYGAAKGAVFGFTRGLAMEAAPHGIRVNAIAPGAATRMGEDMEKTMPPEVVEQLRAALSPRLVAPAMAFLAHESCELNGEVLNVSGGNVGRLWCVQSAGYTSADLTPEGIAANIDAIMDAAPAEQPAMIPVPSPSAPS